MLSTTQNRILIHLVCTELFHVKDLKACTQNKSSIYNLNERENELRTLLNELK
jgi:cell fate (sporulation/competence/biofilm development) regulator YlbF (YheA/YmcA/DUF963 family)